LVGIFRWWVGWIFRRVRVMDPKVAQKRFLSPNDVSGLPRVTQRRAVPVREVPLEGTKRLLNPKEGDLRKLVAGMQMGEVGSSRGSRGMGWVVVVMAGMTFPLWVVLKVIDELRGRGWGWLGGLEELGLWVMGLSFIAVHVVTVLSLAISDGQETLGTRGVVLYWASMLMIVASGWVIEAIVPYFF
jgi:hypothetical protein